MTWRLFITHVQGLESIPQRFTAYKQLAGQPVDQNTSRTAAVLSPHLGGTRPAYLGGHKQFRRKPVRLALHYVGYFFIRFAQRGICIGPEPAHRLAMEQEVSQFVRRGKAAAGHRVSGADEGPSNPPGGEYEAGKHIGGVSQGLRRYSLL